MIFITFTGIIFPILEFDLLVLKDFSIFRCLNIQPMVQLIE